MRVLWYNWVDYLDDERRGGGVGIYQRNLMRAAAAAGIEARFLCSGISYDLAPGAAPRWEGVRHGPDEDRDRRFEIVNSGVLAPAHHSFGAPEQTDHPATVAAFADFLDRTGPYDAVHFNNLEGIPAAVLALKERFPATRFVLGWHNYYPVCPQVNLWFQERVHCADFDGGRACTVCLPHRHEPRLVRRANALAYALKRRGIRPGSAGFDAAFRVLRLGGRVLRLGGRLRRGLRGALRLGVAGARPAGPDANPGADPLAGPAMPVIGTAAGFAARRARMVALINAHCDAVLCVSERAAAVAAAHGIRPGLIRVRYIGSAEAPRFAATAPRGAILRPDGTLGLGYLGYMRRDKGFFFLLDALEALPGALAARLHLTVAAPATDPTGLARLRALGERLAGLAFFDGYTHDRLDEILAGVDVGVVPVLWEDTLPQVAIEMHARRIPLLTADRGGAQELGNCPDMVFRAGDAADFAGRVAALLAGRITAAAYWAGPVRAPRDMAAHLAELCADYAG